MNAILDGAALWLADFHLVATVLLLAVLAALAVVRQPAQRLAVAKATLGALAGLVLLGALPGWSALDDGSGAAGEAFAIRPIARSSRGAVGDSVDTDRQC